MNLQDPNRFLMQEPAELVVIDDDPADRLLLREILLHGDAVGMRMREAGTLAEAQVLIGAETLCVLIDNVLPDGLGMDFVGQLREQWPDLAIVMMTGSGDELTSVEALKRGANDYLPKAKMTPSLLHEAVVGAVSKLQMAVSLRRKQEKLSLMAELIDTTEDLLFIVDCESEAIVHANAATRRALGRGAESFDDDYPVSVSNLFKAGYASWTALRGLLARASPARFETAIWAGSYLGRQVEINARQIFKAQRQYVIGIARDIGEQQRLQADLMQYTVLDPQTQLPTAKAMMLQLSALTDVAEDADSQWLLAMIRIPGLLEGAQKIEEAEVLHWRVKIARQLVEFASLHRGRVGVAAAECFVTATPVDHSDESEDLMTGLREALLDAVSEMAVDTANHKMRESVGLACIRGALSDISQDAALSFLREAEREQAANAGRIQIMEFALSDGNKVDPERK